MTAKAEYLSEKAQYLSIYDREPSYSNSAVASELTSGWGPAATELTDIGRQAVGEGVEMAQRGLSRPDLPPKVV